MLYIVGAVVLLVAGAIAQVIRNEELARRFGMRLQPAVRWTFEKFKRKAPLDVRERVLAVRLDTRTVLGSRWPQAFFAAMAGREHSELITAGVILYRLALWLLPIIVGWIVTIRWQATEGKALLSKAAPENQ